MRLRRWLFGALAPLAISVACGGIERDEIDCEQALVYLQGCCPCFVANEIGCESSQTTTTDACRGTTTTTTSYPAIGTGEGVCILREGCAELVTSGVCDRAQAARGYSTSTTTGDSEGPSANGAEATPVCP